MTLPFSSSASPIASKDSSTALFNELYVAERLIRSVCNLDYPADRLEIQVLDDSTDETRVHVARLVAEYHPTS